MRVSPGASYIIDPGTRELLTRLFGELYEHDLPDVAKAIEHWIVASRGVLVEARSSNGGHLFTLSEYGEMIIFELLAIAQRDFLPAAARRQMLGEALVLAGYAERTS